MTLAEGNTLDLYEQRADALQQARESARLLGRDGDVAIRGDKDRIAATPQDQPRIRAGLQAITAAQPGRGRQRDWNRSPPMNGDVARCGDDLPSQGILGGGESGNAAEVRGKVDNGFQPFPSDAIVFDDGDVGHNRVSASG